MSLHILEFGSHFTIDNIRSKKYLGYKILSNIAWTNSKQLKNGNWTKNELWAILAAHDGRINMK